MQPSFTSRPLRLNPFYWAGYWGGAGVACLGREARYLGHRARVSSGDEKSTWLVRCIVSCGLVAADWWFMTWAVQMDTGSALAVSLVVLAILPKPTPRIPLAAARLIAAGTVSGCIRRGMKWLLASFPFFEGWTVPMQMLWFVIFMGLIFWAVSALFGQARLDTGVTPEVLIERVRGIAPADLEATIHAMKRVAMRRMPSPNAELPALLLEDLDEALVRVQPRF